MNLLNNIDNIFNKYVNALNQKINTSIQFEKIKKFDEQINEYNLLKNEKEEQINIAQESNDYLSIAKLSNELKTIKDAIELVENQKKKIDLKQCLNDEELKEIANDFLNEVNDCYELDRKEFNDHVNKINELNESFKKTNNVIYEFSKILSAYNYQNALNHQINAKDIKVSKI